MNKMIRLMHKLWTAPVIKQINAVFLAAVIVSLTLLLSGCKLYTVVPNDKNKENRQGVTFYFQDDSFDADKFVAAAWDSKVLPVMNRKAVDIGVVLAAIRNNVEEAGKKYGVRSAQGGKEWNFIVKGKGNVLKINTESRNGTMDIDLPPYDHKAELKIQVGPVIKGTSVRDSLDFIKFDDFKNQMDFAEVSNALNKRIKELILSKLDLKQAPNREIEFTGAFTVMPAGEIVVTPVQLTLAGGEK
ncbi:Hypothetical protein LUCI_4983 [Lucifera butyrica]|uniref:Lipoprotein n=1 Tax=Lucifera butyrica TaxID=1351585 RepID=A0A498RF94_9FIRM|nr:DUF2291 domain-containing protein [Lucifera butyrica]VBB09685.1 Hypothetical protein LUCI_4983 [Lucifera butyrica]